MSHACAEQLVPRMSLASVAPPPKATHCQRSAHVRRTAADVPPQVPHFHMSRMQYLAPAAFLPSSALRSAQHPAAEVSTGKSDIYSKPATAHMACKRQVWVVMGNVPFCLPLQATGSAFVALPCAPTWPRQTACSGSFSSWASGYRPPPQAPCTKLDISAYGNYLHDTVKRNKC